MLHVRERDCLICSPWPGQWSGVFFVDGKVGAFGVVFAGHQDAVICANPEFAVLGLGALGACLTWWNYGFSATLYSVALVYGMRRVSLATQSTFCLPRSLDSKTLFFLPTISNPVAQISTIKMTRDAMESNRCFSASHVQCAIKCRLPMGKHWASALFYAQGWHGTGNLDSGTLSCVWSSLAWGPSFQPLQRLSRRKRSSKRATDNLMLPLHLHLRQVEAQGLRDSREEAGKKVVENTGSL